MFLRVKAPKILYAEQELELSTEDSGYEIEVDLMAYRTPVRPATMSDPAEGGELEDFRCEYHGQQIDLSPDDERKALDLLADAETIDDDHEADNDYHLSLVEA